MTLPTILTALALLLWIGVALAPWRAWSTRERLEADRACPPADLSELVAVIPARNEAGRIAGTLTALCAQGRGLRVIVVDDRSDDATPSVVEGLGLSQVTLVRGAPLPPGWTGKVWALSQAEPLLDRPLVLLLDADIRLSSGLIAALERKRRREGAAMASLLAELPMRGIWERWLIPAFVFFFKLLYPFRLVNAARSRAAAAAGGCVLMEREALRDIGGFVALKDALIDDCTLAWLVKQRGHRVWIGLTRSAVSSRRYARLGEIWNMVARTAFTQLGNSVLGLALCTVLMMAAFVAPVLGLFLGGPATAVISALALIVMAAVYVPVLRFYGLSPTLAITLPIAGVLYLLMTWTSAARYTAGETATWRGRAYRVADDRS